MHPQVSTCTRNLDDAIEKLSNIGVIRNNSIIISCGTVTTHLNLKTSEGIALIMLLLDSFIFKVKPSYPRNQKLLGIKILIKCDAFKFGTKKEGVIMGNPFTCMCDDSHVAALKMPLIEKTGHFLALGRFCSHVRNCQTLYS